MRAQAQTPRPLAARFPDADRIARSRWGTVSVAVVDCETGEAFHNETARMPLRTASCIEVPLLLAYLATQNGKLPDGDFKADAEAMIRKSDNNATSRFWGRVGPEKAVAWMQASARSKTLTLAPENKLWWGYARASAAAFAAILAGLAAHTLVTPSACDFVESEMRKVVPAQRLGIPDGTERPGLVAVKNGWYSEDDEKVWRVHSTGIAPVGSGTRRAAVAILTRYPIAYGMAYGQETCKSVARAIFRVF